MAVLGLRWSSPFGNAGGALAVFRDRLGGFFLVRTQRHGSKRTVDEDQRAAFNLPQLISHGDDARNIELAGDDRGVAGGPAQLGNERANMRGIQGGGIGGREVIGKKHRLALHHGQTRLLLAAQLGDDAVAHVLQIGGALGHDAAGRLKHGDELIRGSHRGELGILARANILAHGLVPPAVLDHAGGCGQHFRGLALGGCGAVFQAAGDDIDCLEEAIVFGFAAGLLVNTSFSGQVRAGAHPYGFCIGNSSDNAGSFNSGLKRIFHGDTSFEDSGLFISRSSQIQQKCNVCHTVSIDFPTQSGKNKHLRRA